VASNLTRQGYFMPRFGITEKFDATAFFNTSIIVLKGY